ncbi:MAG: hypothetical protein ABL916_21195 [Burkholderiaceae bacterium]
MEQSEGMEYVADLASIEEFFGAKPVLEYPNLPLHQNAVTVEADLGDKSVWFTFVPFRAFGELRIVGKPFSVTKLALSDISHIAIRKTREEHSLLIRFSRSLTSNLSLSLRPSLMLFWGNEEPDPEESLPLVRATEPASGNDA